MSNYNVKTTGRAAVPRSKRMREAGGYPASGATVINTGASSPSSGSANGHSHANKAALDAISIDNDFYLWLQQKIEGEDDSSLQKVKAGYSDLAYDLDPDSPVNNRFLSKINADVAAGHITFRQGLTALAQAYFNAGLTAQGLSVFREGLQIGEYVQSLWSGSGAAVDSVGNAEVESLKVRSYMEVMELIVNRLSAIEGDQLLTEADTITGVTDLGDGTFRLQLQEKWEGYFTAQKEGNVLKGILNTLTNGHGETALGSGMYYTAWMRVLSVNPAGNTIEVIPYPDSEVPSGKNYPPAEMMRVARWGNATDPSRQSCLYLSSTEGRIVKLSHVTRPIIDKTNYGFVLGEMPEFIKNGLPVQEGQDYVYVRGLVAQDILRMDYQGKPVVSYVDRGKWAPDPAEPYHFESVNGTTGVFETSDVWYLGCRWRALVEAPSEAPKWNSTQWAQVEGNPDFTVEFADTDYLFDPDTFEVTLTVIARLYNMVITDDILDADVIWTRYSEDPQGNPRTASDNAWAIKHAGAGKSVHLTSVDIDFNGYVPRTVRFTATVTLRDGKTNEAAATGTANFDYE